MPLEEYLPLVKAKWETDKRNPVLLSLKNSLQAYASAVATDFGKDSKKAPSVRSALGALTSICSSDGIQAVLSMPGLDGLATAVKDEGGRWDNDKFKYKPSNLKIVGALSGGKAGATFEAEAQEAKQAKKVFKAEPKGYGYDLDVPKQEGKAPAIPGDMNIDAIGSRLSARAVASYKVDKALGCGVLARTRFASATVKDDQALFGSLQDWTGGQSLNSILKDDSEKQKLMERYKNPAVLKQLQQLQLVDYITGQTDRHADNIHITPDNKILGIDHDFSFGTGLLGANPGFPMIAATKNKGLPAYIDSGTSEMISKMEPEQLLAKIRPYLSTAELDDTAKRVQKLKDSLKDGKIKQVTDWSKDVDASSLTAKNSYLYDTPAK